MRVIPAGTIDRICTLLPTLNEKQRRRMVALEAKALGHGGIKIISEITGYSRPTIIKGIKELDQVDNGKGTRKKGAGRKKKEAEYPDLEKEILKRVDSSTRGHPESALLWTSKSLYKIADDLKKNGYCISHTVIRRILKKLGYSLQANKKTREGCKHPDRNAQFEHIDRRAREFIQKGQPVLSIDTKKKELIGNFKNNGREHTPSGKPTEVNAHDFASDALLKAVPYGVYDITRNEGWVNVGISSDTATFAVESIRRYWNGLGKASYPNAKKIMLTADCGGSNSSRGRLFKVELQKLADELNMEISVCHFPPGTSKWNKIEHRFFSFISKNWRGKPLEDLVTIVNLIGNTRTNAGLKVCCEVDNTVYKTGIKVNNEEFAKLNIIFDEFHGEWNYTITPTKK